MDPYEALGVKKTATDAEIKKAFRKIAKEAHPDLHPDDPAAEARFKAASAAYDLLSDPEKRARYDRGEIDETGQERPERHFYREYANAAGNPYGRSQGFSGFAGGFDSTDFEAAGIDPADIFEELLRRGGGSARFRTGPGGMGGGMGGAHFKAPGQDVHYTMEVPFMDAVKGTRTRITLPDGKTLEVKIPEGTRDGQTIRLRGKGGPGIGGGPAGDAFITVSVKPHRLFRREGNDIHLTLPITIDEAILGAKVEVPTIDGPVRVTIPKGASSGQVLRLKKRGAVAAGKKGVRGDQKVELKIVAPPKIDPELEACLKKWRESHAYDPRKGMKP